MRRVLLSCAALSLLSGSVNAAAPSFFSIGDLPGGAVYSRPEAVSNGAQVVVGASATANNLEGFRWTPANGIQGFPGPQVVRNVTDVTPDGLAVFGWMQVQGTRGRPAAFRWTEADGYETPFGVPTGASLSADVFAADDGQTVAASLTGTLGVQAVVQNAGEAPVFLGDFAEGPYSSRANGISGDGKTVVGYGYVEAGPQAFRWTASEGMQSLGMGPNGFYPQIAEAASADGSVIVGLAAADTPQGFRAFRWSSHDGLTFLTRGVALDAPQDAIAWDVSADGTRIVGQDDVIGAFLWTEARGMESVESILDRHGLAAASSGWTLTQATAISPDGKSIAGFGYHGGRFTGWVATVPEPSSVCLGAILIAAAAYMLLREQRPLSR